MWSKLNQSEKMSVRETMIAIAGHPPQNGHQVRWLEKVAHAAHIQPSAARRLWQGLYAGNHWAVAAINDAAELIRARKEMQAYADKIDFIIDALVRSDADFHSETIARYRAESDRLRNVASRVGAVDSSRAEGKR